MTEDPKDVLNSLGERAVQRAVGVVGDSFYNNPTELQHVEAFGSGLLARRKDLKYPENPAISENLELVGQGPLPIRFRGKDHFVTAAAFRIDGHIGHEALAIFTEGDLPLEEQRIKVVVEDHIDLVVQAEGGGSIWAEMDGSLGSILNDGGGILLLPQHMRTATDEQRMNIGRNAARIVGLSPNKVDLISDTRNVLGEQKTSISIPMDKLTETISLPMLEEKGLKVSSSEYVMLPFSEFPFVHLEVYPVEDPLTRHHVWVYQENKDDRVKGSSGVAFRPHSACSSSEVMGASNCDCPDQLDAAFQHIVNEGKGVIMYLDQEARGHGVWAKVATWHLNIGAKKDLFEAFNAAGLSEDVRDFNHAAAVLEALGIKSISLMSNNGTVKGDGLETAGVVVQSMRSIHPHHTAHQSEYTEMDLFAKKHDRGDAMDNESVVADPMKLRRH